MDLQSANAATILSGRVDWVDAAGVERLAEHPLDSLETEYPHHGGRLEGPDDVTVPSEQHPVFYGCYDWHSAVHSHWALVRQLRLFDDHPRREEVVASIDGRLTEAHVDRELSYLEANPGFEKPYGWAWLLHLAAELRRWDTDRATEWASTLEPLETHLRERVAATVLDGDDHLPFRIGTHQNTAFALCCVLDYARSTGHDDLAAATEATARELYAADEDYPVEYEPLGWDFLSPGLVEADLMRRVLSADDFRAWLADFLPDVTRSPYDAVLEPAAVDAEDPGEGVALHLVGLNLSRAWCLAGLSEALPGDHEYADALLAGARRHATAGMEGAFTDDYAGAHWLSSFALYLLTREEGGIAVE